MRKHYCPRCGERVHAPANRAHWRIEGNDARQCGTRIVGGTVPVAPLAWAGQRQPALTEGAP